MALNIAGIEAVVAESYARIFYRNSVDVGFYLPFETREHLFKEFRTGDVAEIDVKKSVLMNLTTGKSYQMNPLGDVEEILSAGGIFAYARKSGIVS